MGTSFLTLPHVLVSWFVLLGTPLWGPAARRESYQWPRFVAIFTCSGFTRVGVRWLVLLFSPLFECSACHSSDCLVSFIGAGSTHDGRRACCCFRVLLGSPVLGSAGWFCSLFSPLFECSACHSSDTCLVSYHGVGSTRVGRRACCFFVAVYRVRGHPKFLHGISSLFPPPASMSGSLPMQWHFLCVVAQVLIYLIQLFSYCLYKSLKPLGIRCDPSLATSSRTNWVF